jgi:C4-dicarboxylate transporter
VQSFYIITLFPILRVAGIPLGNDAAVCNTDLSPIITRFSNLFNIYYVYLIAFKSPLKTAPYHITH